MSKKELVLNDLTLNTIITELRKVLESSYEVNGRKEIGGKVTIHHMVNSVQKNIRTGDTYRCMILFNYNGSCGQYWCEDDIFTFLDDGSIKIKAFNDIAFKDGKLIKATKEYYYKPIKLSKQEKQYKENEAKYNKSRADSYWKSVEEDLDREMNEDLFGEDLAFDY